MTMFIAVVLTCLVRTATSERVEKIDLDLQTDGDVEAHVNGFAAEEANDEFEAFDAHENAFTAEEANSTAGEFNIKQTIVCDACTRFISEDDCKTYVPLTEFLDPDVHVTEFNKNTKKVMDKVNIQPSDREVWTTDNKVKMADEVVSMIFEKVNILDCDKQGVNCNKDQKSDHRRAKGALQRGVNGQLSKARRFCTLTAKKMAKLEGTCEAKWNLRDKRNVRKHYKETVTGAHYCSCVMHELNSAQFAHSPWSERHGCNDMPRYD